jgi:taurine dioxygenase
MSYLPVPPIASMLLARRLPDWGGNTWVASMCAAYENLPAPLK